MNYLRSPFRIIAILLCLWSPALLHAQDRTPLGGCDCPTARLDDGYCVASLVFEGVPLSTDTVLAVETGTRYPKNPLDHVDVLFKVTRTLKGEARDSITIATPFIVDECTYRFIPGRPYLVFARTEDGILGTNRCTPTRSMETVGQSFRDSLEFVRTGHRWVGNTPLERKVPCN